MIEIIKRLFADSHWLKSFGCEIDVRTYTAVHITASPGFTIKLQQSANWH